MKLCRAGHLSHPLTISSHTCHPLPVTHPCSDKRGQGGGRIIAGSVLLKLSALPAPGSSRLGTYLRLGFSYLITPHTLALHTSGVLEALGGDQRAVAAGRVVSEWLADQGQAVVPDSLVRQVGRGSADVFILRSHSR